MRFTHAAVVACLVALTQSWLVGAAAASADPVTTPPLVVRSAALKAPAGYGPGQIAHAYGFDQVASTGAGRVVGIVDAFDSPSAASDLTTRCGTPAAAIARRAGVSGSGTGGGREVPQGCARGGACSTCRIARSAEKTVSGAVAETGRGGRATRTIDTAQRRRSPRATPIRLIIGKDPA